jgi:replicative DNA helicase
MAQSIETIILRNLIYNETFSRSVLPYIKEDYFRQSHDKEIFRGIVEYVNQYKKPPTKEALEDAADSANLVEETYKEVIETLDEIEASKDKPVDNDWLTERAENWCKEKALANAAFAAVAILDGKDKKRDKGAIPELFENALAISFDPSIGHDYLDNAEQRYDTLHAKTHKIPFDLDCCNKATKGGVEKKTLNVLAGGVYVGKTLGLCHLAANYLKQGEDVLYITLEISEENIGFRIDCNLLNYSVDDAEAMPKDVFLKKVDRVKSTLKGKLKIKEYPAGSVHANNFRALLHELQIKQHFKPTVIIVDYIGLVASARFKPSDKTHITLLAVAEELRALAQEYNVPIWTAAQLDAEGMTSSDPGMTNLAGSKVGLPATVDLMWTIVVTEKLKELGQALIIQQKNRYRDVSEFKKFYIGIDRKKMRWYEVDQKAQKAAESQEEQEDDPLKEDEDVKRKVSQKYGQQAYESAYKNTYTKKFGPRKSKFNDFQM